MENPQIDRAIAAGNPLGETPIWCARTGTLYWINCEPDPALFHWDPATGGVRRWEMPRRIGAVAIRDDGGLIVALADGVYAFDTDTAALEMIAPAPHGDDVVLHEGRCDRQGRFWIGSCRRGADGAAWFYRLEGTTLIPQIGGLSITNGLAFSPDGATIYFGDSLANTIWAHDYDVASGTISNRRTFIALDETDGIVDGAAVDRDGGYWIALFRGAALRRYRPDGTLDRTVRLPVSQPTMPAFGGAGYDQIFVTSTQYGKDAAALAEEPGLGDIHRLRNVARGLPDPTFRTG